MSHNISRRNIESYHVDETTECKGGGAVVVGTRRTTNKPDYKNAMTTSRKQTARTRVMAKHSREYKKRKNFLDDGDFQKNMFKVEYTTNNEWKGYCRELSVNNSLCNTEILDEDWVKAFLPNMFVVATKSRLSENKQFILSKKETKRLKRNVQRKLVDDKTTIEEIQFQEDSITGRRSWKGKDGYHTTFDLTNEWLKLNLCRNKEWFNDHIMNPVQQPGVWINLEDWGTGGKRNSCAVEGMEVQALYQEPHMSCCAIMNLANVLFSFGDYFAYNKLRRIINHDNSVKRTVEKCKSDTPLNQALRYAKDLKYFVRKIDNEKVFDSTQQYPMICKISSTHVVAVYKGLIFDAESRHTMTLNIENLNVACGDGTTFHKILKSYVIEATPAVLSRVEKMKCAC